MFADVSHIQFMARENTIKYREKERSTTDDRRASLADGVKFLHVYYGFYCIRDAVTEY